MSDPAAVRAYLKPPRGSFWSWVDQGRVVAWVGGETIAYRREIFTVAQRLVKDGLPPFSAILLMLAATRDNWNAAQARLQAHAARLIAPGGGDPTSAAGITLRAVGYRLENETEELIKALTRIANLAPECRHSLHAKSVLAEVIFESRPPALNAELSAEVVAQLELLSDSDLCEVDPKAPSMAPRELADAIESLAQGLERVDADRLELRMRTGLDSLIRRGEKELEPHEKVRKLLADLRNDQELRGLSRLTSNLMASLHVPRRLQLDEHIPSGGVSDITNRGQLDRLLLSELAADDMTLAVRIALNEALYLRHESPPRQPSHCRMVLMDSGIRSWGVLRVYGTAVGLALAATGDSHLEVRAFRGERSGAAPVDFTTRAGLIRHLEALDTRPHFGNSLEALMSAAADQDQPPEFFLVVPEDAASDAEFLADLGAMSQFSTYLATVNRDGTFRLWMISSRGKKLLREARLDLEPLLEKPAKEQPKIKPLVSPSANLPAICSTTPFPLLLSANSAIRRVTHLNEKLVVVTQDRRLLLWKSNNRGATQLTDRLPAGRIMFLSPTRDNKSIVGIFFESRTRPNCHRVLVNATTGEQSIALLRDIPDHLLGATLHGEYLYLIGKKAVHAYDMNSVEPIAKTDVTKSNWMWGRIFLSQGFYEAIAFDGVQFVFHRLRAALGDGWVIEAPGQEEFVRISARGDVKRLDDRGTAIGPGLAKTIGSVTPSDDRHYVLVRTSDRESYLLKLWPEVTWVPTSGIDLQLAMYRHNLPGQVQVRTRFNDIAISKDGRISLFRGPGPLELKLIDSNLRWTTIGASVIKGTTRRLARLRAPGNLGYWLHVATWSNGNKAYLDSRGMLHLKAADWRVPEITLVLTEDGKLAAWTSDGRVYGDERFHDGNLTWTAAHLDEHIKRFTEGIR